MMNEEMKNKYLIFEVDERYAVGLDKVIEIIEFLPVTRVPETPDYIEGVINLRGQVIPVLNLRKRFKKPEKKAASRKCIVMIDFDGVRLGMIVDTVVDLITIEENMISQPPAIGGNYAHVFIKAIGVNENDMNLIIDGDKIINHNDLDFLQEE